MDSVALNLALVVVFVLIGGFFASAEIALVSLRDGQVSKLADRGRRGTRVAHLKADSNRFLSAVQVGVTFAGFFASSYGATTLAGRLEPTLAAWGVPSGLAATVALILVTLFVSYLSLVFGELAPKRIALQKPEGVALVAAGVLDRVATVFRPLIWLLSKSTNGVVRVLRLDPQAGEGSVSQEELRDMVRASPDLRVEERALVEDAFEAGNRVLSEVMVPRTEVDFLRAELSLADAAAEIADKPHSRYPVIRDSVDDIIGFVHIRDLYTASQDDARSGLLLGQLCRPISALPGSKPILQTLTQMRRGGRHLAAVMDEYGGTDGIVSIEDLVEEIVGEIRDEYDPSARPTSHTADGVYDIDGLLHLNEVEQQTGISLPEGSYDTLAGFVLERLGHIPVAGESIAAVGHRFTVQAMEGRRIARVRITETSAAEASDDT